MAMLNEQQSKLIRLVKTIKTLVAMQYPFNKALHEVQKGFGLSDSECAQLVQFFLETKKGK